MRRPDDRTSSEPERARVTEANRAMWNETADIHARLKLDALLESFRDPSFSLLDPVETEALQTVGVAGRNVAQLSCNNGRELLCVERMGARRCVGFDISDKFIEQARRLAAAAGSRATFVATDLYDIPATFDASFDVAYVTVGALGWFPDLEAWYAVAARLLRPNGHLVIYEMHPILDMFDPHDLDAHGAPAPRHSYFRTEPFFEEAASDYYDSSAVIRAPSYWFHHKMSDVIGGALRAGLEIQRFDEHEHDVSTVFRAFQDVPAKPPLSYLLVARKPE